MKYSKVYEIVFNGKAFSLNDFYNNNNWYIRKKIKDEYGDKFHELIEEAKVEPFDQYKIELVYNSRHDITNTIGMVKVFEDTLTGGQNKKIVKGAELIFGFQLKLKAGEEKMLIIEINK